MLRQNRVEIDMDAIRNNYRILRERVPAGVEVMPVIKANAYGHGMLETALALGGMGASHFAVALPEEGIELRLGGVEGEVLVLGAAMPRAAQDCVRYGLTQTVFTPEMVALLDHEAAMQNREALVHVKLDTGMNRIGVRTEAELRALLDAAAGCPDVRITGAMTHFATADVPGSDFGLEQIARYEAFLKVIGEYGLNVTRHAAASAAALRYPQARYDMVRAGIVMYGVDALEQLPVRPAMRWVTRVTYVKTIEAGETVSYGRRFTAQRPTRIATIPVGYADGYRRAFSNKACALVHGARVPVVGSVCMDQVMLDVTGMDVAEGDEVVLLGAQGGQEITACELADIADTIPYEIMTGISQRVPRVWLHG